MANNKFCTSATSTSSIISVGNTQVNIQLDSWHTAVKFYDDKISKDTFNESDIFQIINHLGNSLITLFGMNYSGKGVNSISQYLNNYFLSKSINLREQDLDLYNKLLIFEKQYKVNIRHLTRRKTSKLESIDRKVISSFFETVQATWIWFMGKLFNGQIPNDQLKYFQRKFN